MTSAPDTPDPNARAPFWRQRYYYLTLKIIVLVGALYLAIRRLGYF